MTTATEILAARDSQMDIGAGDGFGDIPRGIITW